MIDPEVPPPLPPQIVPQTVILGNGALARVVTVLDAARLAGVKITTVERWIAHGTVPICKTPNDEKRVFVDELWRSIPVELRR